MKSLNHNLFFDLGIFKKDQNIKEFKIKFNKIKGGFSKK